MIYLTAPTEAEVGQTFRGEVIDEVEPDVFVSDERLGIKAGASGRQNARGEFSLHQSIPQKSNLSSLHWSRTITFTSLPYALLLCPLCESHYPITRCVLYLSFRPVFRVFSVSVLLYSLKSWM